MVDRYDDIVQSFPEELSKDALPHFVDWFIENVVIVEITAYSDENAYTIFETMNDRGLNLTPSEMLKGFVLSKISDPTQRTEINEAGQPLFSGEFLLVIFSFNLLQFAPLIILG